MPALACRRAVWFAPLGQQAQRFPSLRSHRAVQLPRHTGTQAAHLRIAQSAQADAKAGQLWKGRQGRWQPAKLKSAQIQVAQGLKVAKLSRELWVGTIVVGAPALASRAAVRAELEALLAAARSPATAYGPATHIQPPGMGMPSHCLGQLSTATTTALTL